MRLSEEWIRLPPAVSVSYVFLPLIAVSVYLFLLVLSCFFFHDNNLYLLSVCRYGVRSLPKRQMVLKLKEIHQYTHRLASSDSEDEAPQKKPPSSQLVLCPQIETFKESKAPAVLSPAKNNQEGELQSASQESQGNTSSAAASEESERCVSY